MCYPGLDPMLMCEATMSGAHEVVDEGIEVSEPTEEAASA
jgi:hypothetical protein